MPPTAQYFLAATMLLNFLKVATIYFRMPQRCCLSKKADSWGRKPRPKKGTTLNVLGLFYSPGGPSSATSGSGQNTGGPSSAELGPPGYGT